MQAQTSLPHAQTPQHMPWQSAEAYGRHLCGLCRSVAPYSVHRIQPLRAVSLRGTRGDISKMQNGGPNGKWSGGSFPASGSSSSSSSSSKL